MPVTTVDPTGDEFASSLRGAIATRGLSLDQIRRALAHEGVTVSVATLSYWQSGRSRPERATSLAAIGPLEEVLGLPRGFLASRLPSSRRPEGDAYGRMRLSTPTEGQEAADLAAAALGMTYDDITCVSVHDRHLLNADRWETTHEVRLLLQARRDGVERFPVWFSTDDDGVTPVVVPVTNCRAGRIREFPELSGTMVEMLLERPLRSGETALVEHRQRLVGMQAPRVHTWRVVHSPSREVVIEMQFDPDALPASVSTTTRFGDVVTEHELPVHRIVQAHFSDSPPGRFEVAWRW